MNSKTKLTKRSYLFDAAARKETPALKAFLAKQPKVSR